MNKKLQNEINRIHEVNKLNTKEYERVLRMIDTFIDRNGIDAVPEMVATWKGRFANAEKDNTGVWGGWIPALDFALQVYEESKNSEK